MYGPFTKMSSVHDVINLKTINFPIGEKPPFDEVRFRILMTFSNEHAPKISNHLIITIITVIIIAIINDVIIALITTIAAFPKASSSYHVYVIFANFDVSAIITREARRVVVKPFLRCHFHPRSAPSDTRSLVP